MRTDLFGPGSRYFHTPTAVVTGDDGREIRYLRRRFCPPPGSLAVVAEHIRNENERLDHIAAIYFGDPERFWQICDAHNALHPAELTALPGRSLLITLPSGVPGALPGF